MDFYHMRSYAFITEVVERSATWIGRVLSCVCAQSIEDDSRPSFDLTPAQVLIDIQTNTRHFQSVFKYLLVDVALTIICCIFKIVSQQYLQKLAQNVRSSGFSKPPHGFSLPSCTRTEDVVSASSHLRTCPTAMGFAFAAEPGAFDFKHRDDQLVGGLLKKPDEKQIKGQDSKPIFIDSGEMHEPYDLATKADGAHHERISV
uniref:Neutral ceramidase n=1 Tax=Tanacetum cinerariifolium TaxID=118510 RepID=A0A6L2P4F2_TANCI|nr:neutral ceramidase [Tanacetum cinerariifolium]